MDSSTLVSLLLLALTAIASPFSLIAFSLVLATDRGPRNGIAFIAGWVTTVTLIGVVESLIDVNVNATESNTSGRWVLAVQLVLGIMLLVIWARRRFRPKETTVINDEEKPKPAWQRRLNTMGYAGAFVTGGAVQTWPVMIAAGAAILRLNLPGAQSFAWMFAFALVSTTGLVVLEVLARRNPASAGERLERLQNYVRDHRDSVLTWASLVAGLWLVSRSAIGLL